ncbi:MAG TPA: anti-sigma factor [Terriglobales bacterium]|nr:anti-sigma factor [Terriglobales bacterium]
MTEETHELWTRKLDAYLDGELDSGQMQELDRHLRECPGCAADALRRLQWKRVIHAAGQCYAPNSALRERIQESISPAKPAWWHWRPAFAVTAAVLLLFAGARIFRQEIVQPKKHLVQLSRIVGELADLHVSTLASANPVDVVSSDRHNVKPWFAGKIPFTFDLPELQSSPFELVGGKVSYIEQSPGAQLLFRVRKHQISVFIFQARSLPMDFERPEGMDARSFRLESWQRDGLQYFVIGDVAPEDLRALGELMNK